MGLYKEKTKEIVEKTACTPFHKSICEKCLFGQILGVSNPVTKLIHKMGKVLNSDESVLIVGESGTGKDLVANCLHYATCSNRAEYDFIVKDCCYAKKGFLDDIKAQLHVSNKKRFETLFLKGIEELTADTQLELLDLIKQKVKYVPDSPMRIIVAASPEIYSLVRTKAFRKDLFYRLNTFTLYLPPLRERKEDILPLVFYFLDNIAKENGCSYYHITGKAMKSLIDYDWPGNIRELRHLIFEEVTYLKENKIIIDSIAEHIIFRKTSNYKNYTTSHDVDDKDFKVSQFPNSLEEIEKEVIMMTIKYCNGNRNKASRILKISRNTLYRKMHKYQKDTV